MAEYGSDEQRIALYIDYENIAIGVREARYRRFEIELVLERLLEKGKLLVKRAYADWARYSEAKRSFHEAAIELIEVPQKSVGGKNSADIRLVVDAMDMSTQKSHINCFVVASGDSDFSPLVSKLKENNKYVIGVGVKNSTSDLLMENCDEFIFYEDLVRGKQHPLPALDEVNNKLQECFSLLIDAVLALGRENKEILWGSMVKETMKRKRPSFNESYYGFRTFSHLLEDAQKRQIVTLRRDQRSGSYVVEDLGPGSAEAAAASGATPTAITKPSSTAKAAGGRASGARTAPTPATTPPPTESVAAASADTLAAEPGAESSEAGENGARPRRRRSRGRRGGRGSSLTGESTDTASSESDEGPDASHTDAPEPVKAAGGDSERPAFSFFSWIRGENDAPTPNKEADPKKEE